MLRCIPPTEGGIRDEHTEAIHGGFQALEALRGDNKTIQEVAVRHKVHPNQVSAWKQRAVEGMKEVFSKFAICTRRSGADGGARFGTRAQVVSQEERRAMIEPDHPPSSA